MNIGKTIRTYRKEKNMTQEEMANLLGITAPAVNKWENGITCPDISLLIPIARLLNISVDTLLSYEKELTDKQISAYVQEASNRYRTSNFKDTYTWICQLLYTYPNCESLIWQLSVLTEAECLKQTHFDTYEIENQIQNWYKRVLNSENEALRISAADSLFNLHFRKGEYREAEEILNHFSIQNPERKRRMALIYTHTHRTEEAWKLYEELLMSDYQSLSLIFSSMSTLAIQKKDYDKAQMLTDKHIQLAALFEMGSYHQYAFQLDPATVKKDEEKTIFLMQKILENLDNIYAFTNSTLYQHIAFKESSPEFQEELRNNLILCFQDSETYDYLKDNDWWKNTIASYKSQSA